ncbi:MAG: oligosaccharide flippase family protein [Prevotellaceae bacterium]|jgi:O-antigen/teichoic acid export membrane protein|nr:oligosaccharide flippase family protein [Prevotellaceae bacterium]
MANPLKRLAGETATYGVSTILARVLNFLFVPIYTRMLTPGDYGIATDFLAYIAILQVLLTMGMETGSLRYANRSDKPREVFSTVLVFIGVVAALFFALSAFWSNDIARWLHYDGYQMCIIYVGGILAIDSFTAILFARLRFEYRAAKFTVFKSVKIGAELGFNFLLFFAAPAYFAAHPHSWLLHFVSATPDFSYILFSIFLSCLIALILFIPDLWKIKIKFDKTLWRQMMIYSIPLMIAGLPGVANEFIDRILFRYFLPENVVWQEQLGIFQAGVKIAVLMSLFIQMFRYAAEPHFFAGEKNKQAPMHLAIVMNHFTAFCMVIFLFVMFYIDAIGLLLGKNFRTGLDIVPIMLGAYVLLGMSFNLSMWYKLSGKTHYAVYITTAGLLVTLIINVVFMPVYGYHAAAWGHFFSYLVMVILSAWLGAKYYPVPYNWLKLWAYISVALALFFFSTWLDVQLLWAKWLINTLLLAAYVAFWFRCEKINPMNIITKNNTNAHHDTSKNC